MAKYYENPIRALEALEAGYSVAVSEEVLEDMSMLEPDMIEECELWEYDDEVTFELVPSEEEEDEGLEEEDYCEYCEEEEDEWEDDEDLDFDDEWLELE